jgi:uncharacterized membrane-anchored protein YhcB (DUF1043 family)
VTNWSEILFGLVLGIGIGMSVAVCLSRRMIQHFNAETRRYRVIIQKMQERVEELKQEGKLR